MATVYKKKKDYTIAKDDTLASIAAAEGDGLSWEDLALFNWATKVVDEVNRVLLELIGCSQVDDNAAQNSVLDPALAPVAGDKTIAIPEAFKKLTGLAADQSATVKVKKRLPATAVAIAALDRWFIPKQEKCEMGYSLEGDLCCADKLDLQVHGSNYCDSSEWNKGYGKFDTPLPDEALFSAELNDEVELHKTHELLDTWDGKVSSTAGALAHKTGGNDRYVNVAFSPYTVQLRFYKLDSDRTARLLLQPFWPQWEAVKTEPAVVVTEEPAQLKITWTNADEQHRGVLVVTDKNGQQVHRAVLDSALLASGAGKEITWDKSYRGDAISSELGSDFINADKPYACKVTTFRYKVVADSLKVKWEVKETAKLKRGQLRFVDGAGTTVCVKPLAEETLGGGAQELVWDGKYSPGIQNSKTGTEAIYEDMPYRVQLQAHTPEDQTEGLALAAMQTEVRLYVSPQTQVPKDVMYDGWSADNCMSLGLAPLVPGPAPVEADGTRWYRHQLAQAGFHPGPVTDHADAADYYKIALKEFKRSVPADGSVAAPAFTRLDIDEAEDAATKTAIKTLRADDRRKWLGNLTDVNANNDDPDLTEAESKSDLPDPAKDVIVWADDRQYYTEGDGKDENNDDYFSGNNAALNFGLKDYRGDFDIGDAKTTRDEESIPRPWLPLKVTPVLLSREEGLFEEVPVPTDAATLEAMRRAVGPLRVDWTFDELFPDVSVINSGSYDKDYTRSRLYMLWALQDESDTHDRADTEREVTYTNCPKNRGGIRPTLTGSYYRKAFGYDDLSLAPWRARKRSATESIATVVHDHIASAQVANTDLFEGAIGDAGIYFVPSTVAGDGYRVRSEVVLKKFGDYDLPNLETLAARYPTAPQAHSARLRVWRKSSLRGYSCWGAGTGHWTGHVAGFRDRYKAAHVYFVHEGGASHSFPIADFYDDTDGTHQQRYMDLITNNVSLGHLQDQNDMTLKATHLWPWSDEDDFGWPGLSREGIANDYKEIKKRFLSSIWDETWRKFRYALLYHIVRQVEQQGLLRGHLMVEFKSSGPYRIERYGCDGTTAHRYFLISKDGVVARRPAGDCPKVGCTHPVNPGPGQLTYQAVREMDYLPLPAVGMALGATWLFRTSDEDTWAHEVGHHKHGQHAATAPGAEPAQHDSENNNTVAAWPADTDAADKCWDRNCTMSYAKTATDHFCGKCLLKMRGWKVESLGHPGPTKKES